MGWDSSCICYSAIRDNNLNHTQLRERSCSHAHVTFSVRYFSSPLRAWLPVCVDINPRINSCLVSLFSYVRTRFSHPLSLFPSLCICLGSRSLLLRFLQCSKDRVTHERLKSIMFLPFIGEIYSQLGYLWIKRPSLCRGQVSLATSNLTMSTFHGTITQI